MKKKDLRTLARKKILDIYGAFKTPSHGIHILNGHFIQLNVSGQNDEIFHNLLTRLKKKYDFIELPEACQYINARKTPSRPLLAFTFDDGFADCSNEIAPVLDLFHTKGAFFINPSLIESSKTGRLHFLDKALKIQSDKEFMTCEQIGCLHKKGHLIGNHTMHHITLKNLSLDEAFNEVNTAKKTGRNTTVQL